MEQRALAFHAPYRGPNSLSPNRGRETVDATLFAGARLWSGAEVWINPEIDQGFGLDDTLGVAGFPSGEAYKIGRNQPYLRLPRAFLRQTVHLDDGRQPTEGGANRFAGNPSRDQLVFTVGKFGVTDIFDSNQYAHDPRTDFLNWSAVDAGSFDYAADAWGYTVGAALEWYVNSWTVRGGCSICLTCQTARIWIRAFTSSRSMRSSSGVTSFLGGQARCCSPFSTAVGAWASSMRP